MRVQRIRILAQLFARRISVEEANRRLAANQRAERLASLLTIAVLAALILAQNFGVRLLAALQFLTMRAAELAMLHHFHLFLNQSTGGLS